ncbi:hypothetical protein ACHAXR_006987 [Thalassiosira sp. AJA248-18]
MSLFITWISSKDVSSAIHWLICQAFSISIGASFGLIIVFIIQLGTVPSNSMYPSLQIDDLVVVNKFGQWRKGDIIVFRPPTEFYELGSSTEIKMLIKRIVAIQGDAVEMRSGKLLVNGREQIEPFVYEAADYEFSRLIIPPDSVFVLGDNRNSSFDGHNWGSVHKNNIIGRMLCKF